jgi:hypothetical protein
MLVNLVKKMIITRFVGLYDAKIQLSALVERAATGASSSSCRNPSGLNVTDPAAHRVAAEPEEPTMQYMLLIYGNEAAMATASEAATGQMTAAYGAYTEAMIQAGVMKAGGRLRPSSAATTVRSVDGKAQVLDGPYAETKEQLGGYYIIDAPDLDAALSWAERCPGAAYGVIEVRPIWAM